MQSEVLNESRQYSSRRRPPARTLAGRFWATTSFFAASIEKKKNSTANLQNCLIFITCMCIVVFCFNYSLVFFFILIHFTTIFFCNFSLCLEINNWHFLSFNNLRVCSCLNLCRSKQRMLFNVTWVPPLSFDSYLTCDGCFWPQRYNY